MAYVVRAPFHYGTVLLAKGTLLSSDQEKALKDAIVAGNAKGADRAAQNKGIDSQHKLNLCTQVKLTETLKPETKLDKPAPPAPPKVTQ